MKKVICLALVLLMGLTGCSLNMVEEDAAGDTTAAPAGKVTAYPIDPEAEGDKVYVEALLEVYESGGSTEELRLTDGYSLRRKDAGIYLLEEGREIALLESGGVEDVNRAGCFLERAIDGHRFLYTRYGDEGYIGCGIYDVAERREYPLTFADRALVPDVLSGDTLYATNEALFGGKYTGSFMLVSVNLQSYEITPLFADADMPDIEKDNMRYGVSSDGKRLAFIEYDEAGAPVERRVWVYSVREKEKCWEYTWMDEGERGNFCGLCFYSDDELLLAEMYGDSDGTCVSSALRLVLE